MKSKENKHIMAFNGDQDVGGDGGDSPAVISQGRKLYVILPRGSQFLFTLAFCSL